jgi:phosphoserine phosphatase RsbU/P
MQPGVTPSPPLPRVLVADDQGDVLDALRLLFRASALDGDFVTSPAAALDRVASQEYALALVDLNYTRDTTSGGEGLELVSALRRLHPALPVGVMTGWGTIDTAVEAMRRGARSFVQKPWDNTALLDVVRREIEEARAARERDARALRDEADARLVQRSLLPQSLPALDGHQLSAAWRPAQGYGGDCYDVAVIEPDVLAVSIADVAGKGLPAALVMSNLQAAVRAFGDGEQSPREVCTRVNRLLCRHMVSGRFVSFCYARIDCRGRTITWANAGHNPPLLLRGDGAVEYLAPGGLVMGVQEDAVYDERTLHLRPGDRLVFYTDGITEAMASDGEEYGEARLVDAARRHAAVPALSDTLLADVLAFTGGTLQDDATLITLACNA